MMDHEVNSIGHILQFAETLAKFSTNISAFAFCLFEGFHRRILTFALPTCLVKSFFLNPPGAVIQNSVGRYLSRSSIGYPVVCGIPLKHLLASAEEFERQDG